MKFIDKDEELFKGPSNNEWTYMPKSMFFILYFIASLTFAQQKNVKISVALFPAGDFTAVTSDITGSAKIISASEVTAKNIVVYLKSLKTGIELRDEHAKTKYLDVKNFPEAVLVSATGKNGIGEGLLKIRGKVAKVTGTYHLLPGNKYLAAKFKTKLSEFDIKDINYKGVGVDDDISIEVVIPAEAVKPKGI